MKTSSHLIICVASLFLVVGIPGCLGNGDPDPNMITKVDLYDEYSGEEITIFVEASRNELVKTAIKHMQNEDYDLAIPKLEDAVSQRPDDDKAWYALGVCREWSGDLEGAVSAYKNANMAESKQEYQEARIRAESNL